MTKKELFNIDLVKWPGIVVQGKPVTTEQAAEILIRTNGGFSTNDHSFLRSLLEIFYNQKTLRSGYINEVNFFEDESSNNGYDNYQKAHREVTSKYGLLDLIDLSNYRIVSSWIGGPHGWCNWDGTIFSNNSNIGKWPEVEQVYGDWVKIAQTFPYLDLTCHLLSGESGEEGSVPIVEFRVKDGKVKISRPKIVKVEVGEIDFSGFLKSGRERGCTLETFRKALKITAQNVELNKLKSLLK